MKLFAITFWCAVAGFSTFYPLKSGDIKEGFLGLSLAITSFTFTYLLGGFDSILK